MYPELERDQLEHVASMIAGCVGQQIDAKRKRDSAQLEDAKRKRDSAQLEEMMVRK